MSSISSVSGSSNPYQVTNQNNFAQSFKDFNALGSALQSGDLSTAQSALTTFQQNLPGNSQSSASQPFGKNTQANTDFQTLSTALNSGDVAGAQKAYASLQTDLKSVHKGHHHHHGSGSTPPPAPTDSTTATPPANDVGSLLNAIA